MSEPERPIPRSFAAGRYLVRRQIGEGATRRVLLAHDRLLARDVAITLPKALAPSDEALARLHEEAKAVAHLGDHQHIVKVHDVGRENGHPYVISEYMGGGTVAALLRETPGGRLPLEDALRIAEKVCQALEHAHARGVAHRDVKATNVWLNRDGFASLGGFASTIGPEDARADLRALGGLLHEMSTGQPPPRSETDARGERSLPPAVGELIAGLLDKTAAERSAAAVGDRIRSILATFASSEPAAAAEPRSESPQRIFVGRGEEMSRLRAYLEEALAGQGRVVALAGEPGIGKTRITEELAAEARRRGTRVLTSRCYEGEGAPPYWPWVQVLRALLADGDPDVLRADMGAGAPDIAYVVPELRERLRDLPLSRSPDDEQSRFRFFDSVTGFLIRSASRTPILIVLDDLHWADQPSLLLLRFLTRESARSHLFVVGTYRDVDVRHEHPLAEALPSLRRERSFARISLSGLIEGDVHELLSALAGETLPDALVRAIFRETGGNPFFIEETLRHLSDEGALSHERAENAPELRSEEMGLPESLREVIGGRLARLSEGCRRLLTIGAVIGRDFELRALSALAEIDHASLLEALEEAAAAGILRELSRSSGRRGYGFSHALFRETLYESLRTTQRIALHRRIAETLEQVYAGEIDLHLSELAVHFREGLPGGDVAKAVGYETRAADRAARLMAYEEAAGHYQSALNTLELGERPEDARRCGLLLALGGCRQRPGRAAKARESFRQAAEIARRLGDAEALARAALGYGSATFGALWWGAGGTADDVLVSLLEEAVQAIGSADRPLRARLLTRLAQELYCRPGSLERRAALSEQATLVARRLDDPAEIAAALTGRYTAVLGPDDKPARRALLSEALRLAEEVGDPEMVLAARGLAVREIAEAGDRRELDLAIDAYVVLAEKLRQVYFRWFAQVLRALQASLDGRLADAEQLANQALALGQRAQERMATLAFGAQMCAIRRLQGRSLEVEEPVVTLAAQYPTVPAFRYGVLALHCDAGREAEAKRALEQLAMEDFRELPRDANWFDGLATLSVACCYLRDERRAELLYGVLLPHDGHYIIPPSAMGSFGPVSQYLGILCFVRRRWDDALEHHERALSQCARMGDRPWTAMIESFQGVTLMLRNGPGELARGAELVRRAAQAARELGIQRPADRPFLTSTALAYAREIGLRDEVEAALMNPIKGVGPLPHSSIDALTDSIESRRPDLAPQTAPDGTVTILFGDVENFASLVERLGDRPAHQITLGLQEIVRDQVQANGGFAVESQADGFLLAFTHAGDALRCAAGVQRAVAERNAADVGAGIAVRIGMHTGEPIREGDRFFGKTLILASRIASQARGGEILVSSLTKALTESSGEFAFDEGRDTSLKGLAGQHRVHGMVWRDPGAMDATR